MTPDIGESSHQPLSDSDIWFPPQVSGAPTTDETIGNIIVDQIVPDVKEPVVSMLDVDHIDEGPKSQSAISWIKRMEFFDQRMSGPIHRFTKFGHLGDFVCAFPALLFSVFFVPVYALICFFFLPLRIGMCLTLSTICLLSTTTLMKEKLGRLRPGGAFLPNRLLNLRSVEKNNAMPSGDSAHGGMWLTFTALYFQIPQLLLLIPLVMLGRVYYACHWIGDTIAGSLIGICLGCIVFYLSTQSCRGVEQIDLDKIHSTDFYTASTINSSGWYPVFCFSR